MLALYLEELQQTINQAFIKSAPLSHESSIRKPPIRTQMILSRGKHVVEGGVNSLLYLSETARVQSPWRWRDLCR